MNITFAFSEGFEFAMENPWFSEKKSGNKKRPRKNSRTLWQLTPKSSCLSLAALGLVGGFGWPHLTGCPSPAAAAEAIETASLKESCVRVTQGYGPWRSHFFYGWKWLKMKDEYQDSSNTVGIIYSYIVTDNHLEHILENIFLCKL